MSKLYIGNLPPDVSESTLRKLFVENNLPCRAIMIKRGGYAFVDCMDQSTADKAIDKFNGCNFFGTPLQVEPSVVGAATPGKKPGNTNDFVEITIEDEDK
ncbi:insulin-like growth factor 2 mRNA-binding protein 3-A [Macrosteles quadrilineatus]|uniref:insulin-like growth factor 2 mRNA-binding protein 3-A n=1 Tax=Macrosteles quadrilineatus TaxID=74068 RepID=UPI0023E2CFA9|nr:insulin-like growth factor 2 mRNA-binding protein 3-A [Macrosteles quadrilineatus]XP_054289598.1 insulin-like growth factor 2 mRNA-binding protein 3-A [Macrosteles quadrilineatus]